MEAPYTQELTVESPEADESDEDYEPGSPGAGSWSDKGETQSLGQDDELALVEAREVQRRARRKARAAKKGSKGQTTVKMEPGAPSSILTTEESPDRKRKREHKVKKERKVKAERKPKKERKAKKEPTPETGTSECSSFSPPKRPCTSSGDEDEVWEAEGLVGLPVSASRRTMSMGNERGDLVIDLSGEATDPIAAHVTMDRVCSAVRNGATATKQIMDALDAMSSCQVNLGRSALSVTGRTHQARVLLRGLVDLDPAFTSVGTRRAARELIELDNRMGKAMRALVESLRANPLVRDEMYQRFLRENDCPICQEPFPDPYTRELHVLRFNCDHATHTTCMADWQRTASSGGHARCPICRAQNKRSDLDDGYTLGEPIGPGYAQWDAELDGDDMRALDSGPSDGDDGAFRASVRVDPTASKRITRAKARANEAKGAPKYSEK